MNNFHMSGYMHVALTLKMQLYSVALTSRFASLCNDSADFVSFSSEEPKLIVIPPPPPAPFAPFAAPFGALYPVLRGAEAEASSAPACSALKSSMASNKSPMSAWKKKKRKKGVTCVTCETRHRVSYV